MSKKATSSSLYQRPLTENLEDGSKLQSRAKLHTYKSIQLNGLGCEEAKYLEAKRKNTNVTIC